MTLINSIQNLSNNLILRLSPCVDEIFGDHQCELHLSHSGEKCTFNETVHQLFIDFKKAYNSVGIEEEHNNLIESAVSVKLFRLIYMCSSKTYNIIHTGKYLYDTFPI
jgi:hypothetical protein